MPRGISLDFITSCLLTIILFSVLQALYFQFGIRLHNVVDTQVRFNSLASRLYSCLGKNLDLVFFFCLLLQIAFSLIEEQEGRRRPLDDYISFVSLLADPRYCGTFYYYHVSFVYDYLIILVMSMAILVSNEQMLRLLFWKFLFWSISCALK